MPDSEFDWPAGGTPGLRIGDAAELMQITPKAIQFYMEHPGVTVSVDRDSGAIVAESAANVLGFRGICHKQDKAKS